MTRRRVELITVARASLFDGPVKRARLRRLGTVVERSDGEFLAAAAPFRNCSKPYVRAGSAGAAVAASSAESLSGAMALSATTLIAVMSRASGMTFKRGDRQGRRTAGRTASLDKRYFYFGQQDSDLGLRFSRVAFGAEGEGK